ncbi:flagellar hook-length control protein FliK [Sphingobium sp. YR657]|uniref:flagellar hook-length control protein FliK n=1 Tax=Sphingobium sp. YR657 TaxID=1884366 RepID=UPI003137E01A
MTMLTSLKAMLFPTPAQTGVKGTTVSAEGGADFAQLLGSVGAAPAAALQPIVPEVAVANDVEVPDIDAEHIDEGAWHPALANAAPASIPVVPAAQAEQPHSPVQLAVSSPEPEAAIAAADLPGSVAIAVVNISADSPPARDVEAFADRVPATEAETPAAIIPVADPETPPAAETATAVRLPEQTDVKPAVLAPAAPPAIATAPTAPAAVEQEPKPVSVKAHSAHWHDAVSANMVAPQLPTESADTPAATEEPFSDDATSVAQNDGQRSAEPSITIMAPSVQQTPPIVTQAEQVEVEQAPLEAVGVRPAAVAASTTRPATSVPVDGAGVPTVNVREAATPPAPAIMSTDTSSLPSGKATAPADLPVVTIVPDATRSADQPAPAMPIQLANPAPSPAPTPDAASAPAVAVPVAQSIPTAQALPAEQEAAEVLEQPSDLAQPSAHIAAAKPRAEAVSLLQLVRDHMTLHAPRRTETIAPARDASPDAALPIVPAALNDSAPPPAALAQPTAQTVTNIAPAIPTVDLSASLGAQVVDMGVSGQWIDGLARDIASLSANGAQGRFQINATELGPVEVNIRQGDDGAAISLTVATEAAEQALRQDGDRLKLDASLSAVRISEVKIERAPHVAEVTRAEGSTNQNTAQQQSGGSHQNQGQAAGQNMGQSSTQSHMQGRGQQRENIAFGHKAGNDGAVLNHMDAGDTAGGAVRARYA